MTAPSNSYAGKHRPSLPTGHSFAADYGPVPDVQAGVGLSLGVTPHLTLCDVTVATVRVPLSPEDVEHFVAVVTAYQGELERRRAESDAIEASLAREDRRARRSEFWKAATA